MKHGIELNGIANIILILSSEACCFETTVGTDEGDVSCQCVPLSEMIKVQEQLKLLERYMIAYAEAMNSNTEPPKWHEVRENPKLYPTNRERVG